MMDIDRTVDITQFGTAVSGGELTYTIQITNNTDDENYLKWYARHNNNGSGKLTYEGIKVTEKVPSGTSFVRNSADGGEYSGGVITWNLEDIVPGECVSLTYKVKVNAKAGKNIVSDGGSVDSIPSNTIENTVGGVKLSTNEREKLASIADEGLEKLSTLGTDIGFAEAIYSEIGKKLELPEVTEIVDNLFTYSSHVPGSSKEVGGLIPANYNPMNLFVRQTNVSKSYSKVKSMLIDRYWGGSLFYVGDELKWEFATNGIRDFRSSFLEAGDILIYIYAREGAGNSLQYYPEHIVTMVYDGARLLCADNSSTGVSYSVVESNDVDNVLLKAVFSQLFFALRPSQFVGK